MWLQEIAQYTHLLLSSSSNTTFFSGNYIGLHDLKKKKKKLLLNTIKYSNRSCKYDENKS